LNAADFAQNTPISKGAGAIFAN
ncbi:hypothetical protein LCGC14_2636400, partial [marine sediment metagenome]